MKKQSNKATHCFIVGFQNGMDNNFENGSRMKLYGMWEGVGIQVMFLDKKKKWVGGMFKFKNW